MPVIDCEIGEGTHVWHPDLVNLYGCTIGRNCNIGAFVEIGPNVTIGDNVRIGSGAFIPEGVEIGNNVFIGPKVAFANDKYPPSGRAEWTQWKTVVEDGVSIGVGSRILPSVTLGACCQIGAGAVVTRSVPAGATWVGIPAQLLRRSDGYCAEVPQ